MRLADATGLRIGGKDVIEARLNGQVVWSADAPAVDAAQSILDNHYSTGEYGAVLISMPQVLGEQRLWQDLARTIPAVNDGDPVFVRDDISGNGLHDVSSNSSSRRIYRTDGTSHWLEYNGISQRSSIAGAQSIPRSATGFLMVGGFARPEAGDVFRVHQYDSATNRRVFSTNEFTAASTSYRFSVQQTATYNGSRVAMLPAPASLDPHVLTCRWKGAGSLSEAAINGGAFVTGNVTTPAITNVTQNIEIGGYLTAYSAGRDYGIFLRSAWSQSAEDDIKAYVASISRAA